MLIDDLKRDIAFVAESICESMRETLDNHGHVDTGALLASIRHEEETQLYSVVSYIIADAKNPRNGAEYAEFIELGTGAAHGRPGGRSGSWRYQDRHGKWHTTDGMDADPFIEPALEANMPALRDLGARITRDIEKYFMRRGGSWGVWSTQGNSYEDDY